MDVKITLVDEGNEGRKVMVTVADDKGVVGKSMELQTPGAEIQPTGPQGRPAAADAPPSTKDETTPVPPTEVQFKLPAGGSVKVVEEDSPQVYDADQRATYHPESQQAKDEAAKQKAARSGEPQPTMHPKTGQPAKSVGDMTADEAQKVHMQGQAEAQKTGIAPTPPTPPPAQPQSAKVDEKGGKVDMSKTVSPSPTHTNPPKK